MQVPKGSPDIMKLTITKTADDRPGADVDDGFATTESELAVHAGEAAERERASGLDQTSPREVATLIGKAQHYGIT